MLGWFKRFTIKRSVSKRILRQLTSMRLQRFNRFHRSYDKGIFCMSQSSTLSHMWKTDQRPTCSFTSSNGHRQALKLFPCASDCWTSNLTWTDAASISSCWMLYWAMMMFYQWALEDESIQKRNWTHNQHPHLIDSSCWIMDSDSTCKRQFLLVSLCNHASHSPCTAWAHYEMMTVHDDPAWSNMYCLWCHFYPTIIICSQTL